MRPIEALLEVLGETVPCQQMDDAEPGLKEALKPAWRGGIYCEVLESGSVATGASLAFL